MKTTKTISHFSSTRFIILLVIIASVTTKSFAFPSSTIKLYPHKPFLAGSNQTEYKIFEIPAEIIAGKVLRLSMTAQSYRYTDLSFLKDGIYADNSTYTQGYEREGESTWFLIKRDDNSYFYVESNYWAHYIDNKELILKDYYLLVKNKKDLKTINEETIKQEAVNLLKSAALVITERENNEKAEYSRRASYFFLNTKSATLSAQEEQLIKSKGQEILDAQIGKNYKVKKIFVFEKDWNINRDQYNQVISKSKSTCLLCTDTQTGKCYFFLTGFGYEYLGNGFDKELKSLPVFNIPVNKTDDANYVTLYRYKMYEVSCDVVK